MVVVQAEGCAPIVRAFNEGARHARLWENAHTIAPGIRVPVAVGDYLILDAVRESGGACITVTDDEMLRWLPQIAARTGLWPCPESTSTVIAATKLRESGWLREDEDVICFFTSSSQKRLDIATIPTGPVLTPGDPQITAQIDAEIASRGGEA